MNEHQSDGQSTTKRGSSSEPSARDRAGIEDFAFTEIKEPFGQVHIELIKASDLQKYRDVITFITNDDSLLSNMGALRMARHMYTIADALATAQREAAGLRGLVEAAKAWAELGRDPENQKHTLLVWAAADHRLLENVNALTPAPEAGR